MHPLPRFHFAGILLGPIHSRAVTSWMDRARPRNTPSARLVQDFSIRTGGIAVGILEVLEIAHVAGRRWAIVPVKCEVS